MHGWYSVDLQSASSVNGSNQITTYYVVIFKNQVFPANKIK